MSARAVFLDRDGVVIENIPYLSKKEEIRILPGVAEGIRLLNTHLFKVIIVTNQSAIGRGIITEEELHIMHNELSNMLRILNAQIDDIYYCPHHPEATIERFRQPCLCRKPSPGMINEAANAYSIDLSSSYMIGDSMSDIETGIRAGCTSILISNEPAIANINQQVIIKPSLLDAARYIVYRVSKVGNR